MDKIRIGNDIHIEWSIFRDDQPEVFEGKDVEVRLIHTRTRDVMPLEWVISDGVVSATFYGKDQIDTGDYKLMLVENNGAPNMATIDECKAFTLVQCSCQEQKEEPSTSLQLHKVQLTSSFALSGGGNISVEGYPNVDELEEVKELSGDENIIVTDSEGNKKTTIGNIKEYVVKDISELPPFRIFETESDYNAVKDELGDCVVCLRDTGVMLYHVYSKAEDGEEGGGEIEDKYIRFADAEVQRILVENFSSDGVGMTSEDITKVTSIGSKFQGNKNITSFNELPKFTNVTKIESYAFNGCTSLKTINLSKIDNIGQNAFYGCTLLEQVIFGNVTSIGASAFANCTSLSGDVNLQELTAMYNNAFFGTNISSFIAPNITTIRSYTFSDSKALTRASFKGVTTIENNAFFGCSALESIEMENVVTIEKQAFSGCNSLSGDMILLNLAGDVASNAFSGTNISSIIAPNVTTVRGYSINDCKALTKVLLSAVTSIENSAFYGCSALEAFICNAITPPTIDSSIFPYTNSTFIIYVPDASVEAYKTATNWSQYSSRIKGISELPIDNPTLYNEIKDYLDGVVIKEMIIKPNTTNVFKNTLQLTCFYKSEVVTPQWTVDGDATIDTNGLLYFKTEGEATVTATYNGVSESKTYYYYGIVEIVNGVTLDGNGNTSASPTMSTVGFVPTKGATTIKWGVTGGTLGLMCEYKDDGTCADYWGASANPRTVGIKSYSTFVKASFSTAHLDYAYIMNATTGEYLWKGKNVE